MRTKQLEMMTLADKGRPAAPMAGPEFCKFWESCGAPLCPMDPESLRLGVWYRDEAICKRSSAEFAWLRIQRRTARRGSDTEGFFTYQDFFRASRALTRKGRRNNAPVEAPRLFTCLTPGGNGES